MKKVVLTLAAIVLTATLISCKNDAKEVTSEVNPEQDITQIQSEDIALADVNAETMAGGDYVYVLAPSGLSLREYGNLQSDKLAKMPYGTKVKVINAEDKATMTVGGIKGGMDEVEFNHKKGYAFNGYLSKYFPPELNITAKGYASELNQFFPEVVYSEENGGTVSSPENTESILLPEADWHDAFFIAQRLFDFPKEFDFPNPKGKDEQTVADSKPKKDVWTSELDIRRKENTLERISYVYKSKKLDNLVVIEKTDKGMKISKTEKIK
ncbi:SH3 domain-containing protein [Aureitalea sp. L0-47]|uniref:SH3 domain-containing protein n=1 Tax=Aureitalea sp. L0-47 TaxID=2816962 RepID=UPI0022371E17|nr:SH3 domain-containing protein [Aureitalea sp. L0-47]MCW5520924.1 SH3 domain-containing protein [Aureitalea sp. L0-47]